MAALKPTPHLPEREVASAVVTSAADALAQAERVRALGDSIARWEDCAKPSELVLASRLYGRASRLASLALGRPADADASAAPWFADETSRDLADSSELVWTRDLRARVLRLRQDATELISAARRLHYPARKQLLGPRVIWSACAIALLVLTAFSCIAAERIGDVLHIGDVSADRPWLASSAQAPFPKRGRLGIFEEPFFFHTATEPDPMLELDLGQMRWVRRMVIGNRIDCCADRAVPLAVELSQDRNTWLEIARRSRVFRTLRFTIKPLKARWVRMRVLRPSILHLESVLVRE